MDDEAFYKVVYLIACGWEDFTEIQEALDLSEEEMSEILDQLAEEQIIERYTIH